jgi:cell division protease FtsH
MTHDPTWIPVHQHLNALLKDWKRAMNAPPEESASTRRKRWLIAPNAALAQAAFEAATTPALRRRFARARGLAVVVTVPSAGWIAPIKDQVRRFMEGELFARDGSDRKHLPTVGNDVVATTLCTGNNAIGVSMAPDRLLPSALVTAADVEIIVSPPGPDVLRRAMRLSLRGRLPPALPHDLGAGFDFADVVCALRPNTTCAEAIRRLGAAGRRRIDPVGAEMPRLEDAIQYGAGRDFGLALAADVAAVRRGEISWSEVDRGVVLFGPPGTGKTWLVRLIARACGLPLIESSVADLFATSAGYLDSVIKAQRSLFERAAATSPCCLFLDEIDAMPNRAKISPRGRDWWMPVVNDFLLLLASTPAGVIVFGATNRLEDVDEAALRPGRLERAIEIGPPATAQGLAVVIRFHLGPDLAGADLVPVAVMGLGATSATAMEWVRAARRCARQANRAMTIEDLRAAVAPADDRSQEELRQAAIHEAGHAVVALALGTDEIAYASILRRPGSGGGLTMRLKMRTGEQIERQAMIALGGRAAEIVVLGRPGAGAGGDPESDLAIATRSISSLHASLGLGNELTYRADPDEAHELIRFDLALRATVGGELNRLAARAEAILRSNRAALDAIAAALLTRRHLDGEAIQRLFADSGGRLVEEVAKDSRGRDGSAQTN